jgi:ectoine hydroxylase-related dioxygenase (phytanoyl-CoA dioxygenase family)
MSEVSAYARQVEEQGFCVLEGAFDASQTQKMRELMDAYWAEQGSPPMADWGFGINPVALHTPELMAFFALPELHEILRSVLDDEVRLVHAGARMSNAQSSAAIGWHHHYGWDVAALPGRAKIERLLAAIYVEGSNVEYGPLVVLPRSVNDAMDKTPEGRADDLPAQIKVQAPPGSVVIFDTALWHNAHRGTQPHTRHLLGAHFQGWSDDRAHAEDNLCDVPAMEPLKQHDLILRGLLEKPASAPA